MQAWMGVPRRGRAASLALSLALGASAWARATAGGQAPDGSASSRPAGIAEKTAPGPEAPALYRGDARKGEIELLAESLVFENKWVRFYNDTVRFPNGREGTYNRVSRPELAPGRISGSAVLAVTVGGEVILEDVFRHPIRQWTPEIPRGGFEPGETLLATGQRELLEETGYRCKEWRELGLLFPDSALTDYSVQLLLARDCSPAKSPTEKTEALRINLRRWTEVLRMGRDGEIKDSMTLAAIFRAGPILSP